MSGSVTSLRSLATITKTTNPRAAPPAEAQRKSRPTSSAVHPHRRGCDRRTQGDESRGVVEQRLALEDGDDPSRQADPAGDRGGGDGVRRGDDGADGDRDRPRDARHDEVDERADAEACEDDEADRQEEDRAPVGVEVDQRGLDRGGVEQRRQQAEQHDLGLEVDLGARTAGRCRRRRRRSAAGGRAGPGVRPARSRQGPPRPARRETGRSPPRKSVRRSESRCHSCSRWRSGGPCAPPRAAG